MPPSDISSAKGTPFFVRWLPRVLTILAVLMLINLITPEDSWLGRVLSFVFDWIVPITPVDFVSSVILFLLDRILTSAGKFFPNEIVLDC